MATALPYDHDYGGECDGAQCQGNGLSNCLNSISCGGFNSLSAESIYAAVFGVGNYTFSKWKIAISGLYKTVNFALIGPHEGKPVVLDDTCYLLACGSEQEARIIHAMLSSKPAKEFYRAYIFWDAKRPITTKLLNRLDINKLAQECGVADELAKAQSAERSSHQKRATQIRLLEETTYPTIL